MVCRSCRAVAGLLIDRPMSSKIGARVFSRYLSTTSNSRLILSRTSYVSPSRPLESKLWTINSVNGSRRTSSSNRSSQNISSWTELGIGQQLVENLFHAYPHINQPTQAQKLFLLAVGAGKEVYLKDDMGRGKTLALALSAMNIIMRSKSQTDTKVMILVPTLYLAHQIHTHLLQLSPPSEIDESLFTILPPTFGDTTKRASPNTPIIISTPKDLLSYDLSNLDSLKYIFLDEPDTMIGPLPSRHSTPNMLINHTLFKHPPPIISSLNNLLNIQSKGKNELDYSCRRNDVNTIWISSSLNKDFKRLVKTRGWIKKSNSHLVDLDFTQGASDKLKDIRNRLLNAIKSKLASENADPNPASVAVVRENHRQNQPEHYALVINSEDGSISTLDPKIPSSYIPPNKEIADKDWKDGQFKQSDKRGISANMIEALSIIHLTSPPPKGKYSLILPPEGISLNTLSEELSNLGISSLIIQPELINLDLSILSEIQPEIESELPILLAKRSSITGIHLQDLHTIYLLDGLDYKGLTKNKRQSGGVKDKLKFYDLVTGRLGRLGTDAAENDNVRNQAQRVISIVMEGTEDEKRMKEMFEDGENKWTIKEWDIEGMNKILEEQSIITQDGNAGASEEVKLQNA
ncbi:uncharacterized protein I206_101791 [Kwoniella pini CBS 10737]|uniref:ATP-dependent RNA helicase n=1 Tax=Kwoniella pini CBS 10737 TaxID=1296096 RepID=A0A1B9HVP7_9TREE|nr:uncharacterized protein I206_06236 [Kwoniella pini CBS 10737]OCF47340.1 hypothetical protein I206_06236 [Kwoniella pini CBS 10737]